jgi:uncharacterized membrane protein YdjX (TVP38/TMEM64 family)
VTGTALRPAASLALLAVAALLLWAVLSGLGFKPAWLELTPAQIDAFIRAWGMWSVVGAMALMVLHSFVPVPAEIIAVANGMLFGPFWGVVITWSGAMLGAVSAFAASRWLGRPVICRFVAMEHRAAIERWTVRPGSLLLLRLIPIVSFNLVNFAAGLAGARWWDFLWTTALGILPLTVLSVVLGTRIFDIAWWGWILIAAGIVALGWAGRAVLRQTGGGAQPTRSGGVTRPDVARAGVIRASGRRERDRSRCPGRFRSLPPGPALACPADRRPAGRGASTSRF